MQNHPPLGLSDSILHLPCQHCSSPMLPYEGSQNQMVALEVEWATMTQPKEALAHPPEENLVYEITLSGPLSLHTDVPFWCLWQSPYSYHNGFEQEEHILSLRFCQVACVQWLQVEPDSAKLLVKVRHIAPLRVPLAHDRSDLLSQERISNLLFHPEYRTLTRLGHFVVMEVNIQSDLGVLAIIDVHEQPTIIALNDWDRHQNLWHACHQVLSSQALHLLGM